MMTRQEFLEALAVELGQLMLSRQWLLVTAESCTGGGLAHVITSIPGCSQWFDQGFITYSNASKKQQLGVESALLEKNGAVSGGVAVAMAEGALKKSGANAAIAITGIAGPDGGSQEKPVGTVWIAWSIRGVKTFSLLFQLGETREEIRNQAIEEAFKGLINVLKKNTV